MVTRVMHMHTGIMINTLSNAYCEISLVVKALHRTRAIRALTTRDICQIILLSTCVYISIGRKPALNYDIICITKKGSK